MLFCELCSVIAASFNILDETAHHCAAGSIDASPMVLVLYSYICAHAALL
jgi:hypothetical protein